METVGWQSDPDGRGTFTLVSNCIFTLLICVYSAMHLNVPPRGESVPSFWLRNIRWALLGIFGPELVVFIAWRQYLSAKAIAKKSQSINSGRDSSEQECQTEKPKPMVTELWRLQCGVLKYSQESQETPSDSGDLHSGWNIVNGFCAGMGCFAFNPITFTTDTGTPVLAPEYKRLTLTARGVALLADCGLLPDIETNYLKDKSKSDGLSKFIAYVQATWLIVQVIGRLVLGLQVTLLEINTLGHVFCALLIYVLWWHKPRMVQEPISLDGNWMGPLCAYMYMSSSINGQARESTGTLQDTIIKPELTTIALLPDEHCKYTNHGVIGAAHDRPTRSPSDGSLSIREWTSQTAKRSPLITSRTSDRVATRCTTGGSFVLRRTLSSSTEENSDSISHLEHCNESQDCDTARALRWCLAAEAVLTYPAIKSRFTPVTLTDTSGNQMTSLQQNHAEEFLEEHCSNWSTEGLLPGEYGLVMGMALWFASMAFGAIHAAAWYDYFPTPIESWLWRCSAIYISWSGLVWCVINLIAQISKPFDDYWNRTRLLRPPFANSIPVVVAGLVCGALYIFARGYLVVEAFISIRKLPLSAYQTPDWTQVIPHL